MKINLLTQILSLIALTLSYGATFTQPSYAQSKKFECGMSRGVPATLVRTTRGTTVPLIRWVDTAFAPPWTPERRCEEISARFQRFYDNGTLNFLRAGSLQGQPVLCVAGEKGGPCLPNGVLVTFKHDRNPQETLQLLLDYRGGSGARPIELSGPSKNAAISSVNDAAYLDVKKFIDQAEAETGAPCRAGQPAWKC